MPERPVNNLPPGSQPWARDVVRSVEDARFEADKANLNNRNAFKTMNATLEQLAGQQEALQAQQEALQAQQEALQAEVARIDGLVNNQVTVGIAPTVTSSGWVSSTSHADKAATSIAVPAGYSRAFVFALASMHFQDTAPNGGWVRAVILGEAGGEMGGLANLEMGQSASHTRALEGLSGGSITLSCQMRSSVGTAGMPGRIAQISGLAIFLR